MKEEWWHIVRVFIIIGHHSKYFQKIRLGGQEEKNHVFWFFSAASPENIRFCGPWLCRSFNFLLKNAASEWRMILTIPDITPYWCADQPHLSLSYGPSIWSLLKALVLVNLNSSLCLICWIILTFQSFRSIKMLFQNRL